MTQYFGRSYDNIGTNEKPIYRLSSGGSDTGGTSSGEDGHIWRFISEGSAPLLIDQRVLFAPQHSDSYQYFRQSQLYVSDISGGNITQTIFNGPFWPEDNSTSQSTGEGTAVKTSLFADWSTATSTNVDVYISYNSILTNWYKSNVLKIQFNRTTQTFGTPYSYGRYATGINFFDPNTYKIVGTFDGDLCKTFLITSKVAGGNSTIGIDDNPLHLMEQTEVYETGKYWGFNGLSGSGGENFLGDFRPLIKSLDGSQLVSGFDGTGGVQLWAHIMGINHVTGRVYYRGLHDGFMYIFQIDSSAPGSNYVEKLWNMTDHDLDYLTYWELPITVKPELTYYKTVLLPTLGGDNNGVDATVNFDSEGNETGISYGSYYNDATHFNVDMGIIKWDPSWN